MNLRLDTCLAAFAAASAATILILSTYSASAGQIGLASFYKSGKTTANGEAFKPNGMIAEHRTFPFGTIFRVTHLKTGKSVVVRINDRGSFIRKRIIDLSLGAARKIGLTQTGVARIRVDRI